jgi:hypothetical protein
MERRAFEALSVSAHHFIEQEETGDWISDLLWHLDIIQLQQIELLNHISFV